MQNYGGFSTLCRKASFNLQLNFNESADKPPLPKGRGTIETNTLGVRFYGGGISPFS